MTNFKENIDKQFEINRGKNLFYYGILNTLKFSSETADAIEKAQSIDSDSENSLIDYLTNKAVQEFCNINQYYSFDKNAQSVLRNLYVELFVKIKSGNFSLDAIAEYHYSNLIKWLKETNSFAEKIYKSKEEAIEPVACSEYSPELQIEILQIDINQIAEPILDIACGKHSRLVNYLRQKGFEAYGFDRFAENNSILSNSDWFEFNFGLNKWGTLISNLGFTNHFQHHHMRNDGNYIEYAKKYVEILNSLKPGGAFHYAPDLPFIEQYLDKGKYQIEKYSVGNYEYKSTIIKKTE